MNGSTLSENGLHRARRYITDHSKDGKTTFSTVLPEELPYEAVGGAKGGPADDRFALAYTTNSFPVKMENNADVEVYGKYLENKPGIMLRGGTVLRYVDIAPGNKSPMHRTVSLDYGVVIEGEVELILDSGETRVLKRGDCAIQRATNHAWRNTSKTEWARMLYVLQDAVPFKIGGQPLKEDYGGIEGVRLSDEAV